MCMYIHVKKFRSEHVAGEASTMKAMLTRSQKVC